MGVNGEVVIKVFELLETGAEALVYVLDHKNAGETKSIIQDLKFLVSSVEEVIEPIKSSMAVNVNQRRKSIVEEAASKLTEKFGTITGETSTDVAIAQLFGTFLVWKVEIEQLLKNVEPGLYESRQQCKKDIDRLLGIAENYLYSAYPEEAEDIYRYIASVDQKNAVVNFRLGEIYNRTGRIHESHKHHMQAIQGDVPVTQFLFDESNPLREYRYEAVEEHITLHCPLCGKQGVWHSCYNMVTNQDFIIGFNPVRVWVYCNDCHHIHAWNHPVDIGSLLENTAFDFNLNPKVQFLSGIGTVMRDLRKIAKGNRLLEVGIGAGEMTAVAKEYLFDVTGIDIRKAYANAVGNMLGVNVIVKDFMMYDTGDTFDVICMGDVLEHLPEPVKALKKVHDLLRENGVLWVSTPNFDSAYARIMKDKDPMWRVCEHLNYFSFTSLQAVLETEGFQVVDYKSSNHYYGSMEITAVKK